MKVAGFFILATAAVGAAAAASPSPRQPVPATINNNNNNNKNNWAPSPLQPDTPYFTFEQLFQLQKKFLNKFISPANTAEAQSINSSLFAPNVQGRVDITRTFTGQELNTEYLFGLFANLATSTHGFTLLGVPVAYEITHFAASQNIASASTRFNFSFPVLNGLVIPIEIETWNVFAQNGSIAMYDASFKRWQWTFDYMIQTAAAASNMTLPQITTYATEKLATSICGSAQTYCNGTNAQYKSTADCYNYLTTQVRFGEAYEMGRNTLLCRMVHQNMVPSRPSVHCPHIGPAGGGYCDDAPDYVETVAQDYFSNYPFAYGGSLTNSR